MTVEDNINPVANCVAPFTAELDDTGTFTIGAAAVDMGSSDACGIQNLSLDPTTLTCDDRDTATTFTLTALDANGNSDVSVRVLYLTSIVSTHTGLCPFPRHAKHRSL